MNPFVKAAEIGIVKFVRNTLAAEATTLDPIIGTEVTGGVESLIALVQKADTHLGPVVAGLINTVLSIYQPQLLALEAQVVGTGPIERICSLLDAFVAHLNTL